MIPYIHNSRPKLQPPTPELIALATALHRDVEVLATDIGPRGTHAPDRYRLAADFIEKVLTKTGYTPVRTWFDGLGEQCCNIEVAVRGTQRPDDIIVVGAHYDSVPNCPAANDNASGVAGVLALARQFRGNPQPCTLRFVLFANEEPPFFNLNDMGSQIYAREARKRNDAIRGMVCLETIGCYLREPKSQAWPVAGLGFILPTVGDFITIVGPESARAWIKRAAEAFEASKAFPLLAAAAPPAIDEINFSDHRGFNEVGYPAFMVTDTAPFRYAHYHKRTDTPEKLDYESMARVVQGVAEMIVALADAP